jgi:hypothetical protein
VSALNPPMHSRMKGVLCCPGPIRPPRRPREEAHQATQVPLKGDQPQHELPSADPAVKAVRSAQTLTAWSMSRQTDPAPPAPPRTPQTTAWGPVALRSPRTPGKPPKALPGSPPTPSRDSHTKALSPMPLGWLCEHMPPATLAVAAPIKANVGVHE